MTTNISITATDVDALARIAYAEAGNIFNDYKTAGYSDADAAKMSYGMVIDIIINRVAAGSSTIYGSTIQAVIDKNNGSVWQFSAVQFAGDVPIAVELRRVDVAGMNITQPS
ncbi:hypothetical protein HAP41_0000005240 [Bradyrhizobium barranii subsp. apii]|uniref:Uncharacterized protein n=1 Tax=Bradyrhizobium barranii subsp. apii TaxID=2819348 RepID=A0A8T5VQE2_9BRAD|nr:hypothetical protein [Bradyrhizobium barranii]UPT88498.1 hypothetical protein HAP41_0000005240 [Bradyrhizobium barranii subsp. apii]